MRVCETWESSHDPVVRLRRVGAPAFGCPLGAVLEPSPMSRSGRLSGGSLLTREAEARLPFVVVLGGSGAVHLRSALRPDRTACGREVQEHRRSRGVPTCLPCSVMHRRQVEALAKSLPAPPPNVPAARPRAVTMRLPKLLKCRLRCVCGSEESKHLPAEGRVREVLAELSCGACGRIGAMRLTPSAVPTEAS